MKKINDFKIINEPKILIYDNDNICYITGYCGSFVSESSEPIAVTSLSDTKEQILPLRTHFSCEISNSKKLNNIELDDTLMKRIAKFNKEIDIKKLEEKIKEKEKQIKELDEILTDRKKRMSKLKEFIANIYEIDVSDEEEWDY